MKCIDTYQYLTGRTAPQGTEKELLSNYAMGLCGEVGELVDHLKKCLYHGHSMNDEIRDKIIKEAGDIEWYLSRIMDTLGVSMSEVCQKNIDKLKRRYPKGFRESDSVNRIE